MVAIVNPASRDNLLHPVTVKLDDSNFFSWRQQVEGVILTHGLQKYVVDPDPPQRYLNEEDRAADVVNPAHLAWEKQDSTLFTWLLSTISDSVWDAIQDYFQTQNHARSAQLRTELRNITKGTRTVTEFLKRVKTIVNTLILIGDPVSHRDHLDAIFDGLPEEFNSLATVVSNRSSHQSIAEIESLIITYEARLDRMKKRQGSDVSSTILLTQAQPDPKSQPASQPQANVVTSSSPSVPAAADFPASSGGGDYGADGGGRGGDYGGRGGGWAGDALVVRALL